MATIYRRQNGLYQAIVRRVGYPTQSSNHPTKAEAKSWALQVEAAMAQDRFVDPKESRQITLGGLLEDYLQSVTPKKRGSAPEISRINQLLKHPVALKRLSQLRKADFADYRDERLQTLLPTNRCHVTGLRTKGVKPISPKTVREELLLLSAVLNWASKERDIAVENFLEKISKPPPGRSRNRRLCKVSQEEQKLIAACLQSSSPDLAHAVTFAIETGMRCSELTRMQWQDVDFEQHVVSLELTKNGERREVPMSEAAERALLSLGKQSSGQVFSFGDPDKLSAAFAAVCTRGRFVNLRLHDLRHEAASRLAPHMPVATLAKIMGWKTLQMAMRYYNPTGSELAQLVRSICKG